MADTLYVAVHRWCGFTLSFPFSDDNKKHDIGMKLAHLYGLLGAVDKVMTNNVTLLTNQIVNPLNIISVRFPCLQISLV